MQPHTMQGNTIHVGLLLIILALHALYRRQRYDLDKIPGPWKQSLPVVGNVLECLRPDFHHVILDWADRYGGILRAQFLWQVSTAGGLMGSYKGN